MKTPLPRLASFAAIPISLLLLASPSHAQQAPVAKDKDEVVKLEAFTVTTGYRSPKALDQIPGAVTLISPEEVSRTQSLTDDATAVLARTVPGYAPTTQAMQNTGETLRGRVALRLFDGISQTTPLREGNRNATFTDLDIVSQIEVINGPSASEGIGAAGGIINYISKSPTKNGHETTVRTKMSGQGYSDSFSWRAGVNYAFKDGNKDVLVGLAYGQRGMAYDAKGRLQGLGASGAITDTVSQNLFVKGGYSFGDKNNQRLTATVSQFHVEGRENYVQLLGDRARGITDSAIRGRPPGNKSVFNDFDQYALAYRHNAILDGKLNVQVYKASQRMRFVPELGGADKQDPLFAPLGTLVEQSEIDSQKKGLRSSWAGTDVFQIKGLELTPGFDYMEETAQQRLALTNRLWVPPMNYTSKAPFVQGSFTSGPLTISGGVRR
ncbi:MAG: TonB-dependent receptor plug domain-containing protein, partial [Opitutaceae bacterium]